MKIRIHPGIMGFIGSIIIRVLGFTWRIEWRGLERLGEARGMSPQLIYTFWHGRFFVLSFSHRNRGAQVLSSGSPDGDLMTRICARLGYGSIVGSTTRGGAKALRSMSVMLKKGLDIALTVDGPRGPRGVVQQGAIALSRLTGNAIVPVSNTARPRLLINSWDRFQVPFPFAKVVISFGEPFLVPQGAGGEERERYRILLQERLHDLTARLDRGAGYGGLKVWPHEDH